jgi:SAM-dependent methyltransferase
MNKSINVRNIAAKHIKKSSSRILELGPLNRCLLDRKKYKNYYFGDIRSTQEIKDLYKGNEYLEKTGLTVDLDSIINIDFVIKSSYKETFKNIEKFDYVIVSHVLEHIPNLLFFFEDIQNILKPNGELIILYPDRRFCFDHLRTDSKFSDIYDVYVRGVKRVASQVLDFYSNVVKENEPTKFWDLNFKIPIASKRNSEKNLQAYESTARGILEGDIHYWPFSDTAFLKFLYDCCMYKIFNVSIKYFIPTQINTQEFLLIIDLSGQFKPEVFFDYIQKAHENYYRIYYKILDYEKQIEANRLKIIDEKEKIFRELLPLLSNVIRSYEKRDKKIEELEELVIEKSRIRYMIKGLFIKIFMLIKRILLFIPLTILNKIKRKRV